MENMEKLVAAKTAVGVVLDMIDEGSAEFSVADQMPVGPMSLAEKANPDLQELIGGGLRTPRDPDIRRRYCEWHRARRPYVALLGDIQSRIDEIVSGDLHYTHEGTGGRTVCGLDLHEVNVTTQPGLAVARPARCSCAVEAAKHDAANRAEHE